MTRRKLIWLILGAVAVLSGLSSLVALAFFVVKRILSPTKLEFESSLVFNIGKPTDFPIGIDTRFLQSNRVFVVRNEHRLFVIHGRCTHLGCTPDWHADENKFRCPCHGSHFCMGSAFDGNGLNCEGPAPRPLDRVQVKLDENGNAIVDTGRLYHSLNSSFTEFDDRGAYISITRK